MTRPDWDTYFLGLAEQVAGRSTCQRAAVGAVIVRDRRVLATGYNGSLPNEPHCIAVGCLIENGHCVRTVHAETNAIAQAAKFGTPVDGATLYYWDSQGRGADSCPKCWQLMRAAGITRIVGVGYEWCDVPPPVPPPVPPRTKVHMRDPERISGW